MYIYKRQSRENHISIPKSVLMELRCKICLYSAHLKHMKSGSIIQFIFFYTTHTDIHNLTLRQHTDMLLKHVSVSSCIISILSDIHFSLRTYHCPSTLLSACTVWQSKIRQKFCRFNKNAYKVSPASVTLGIRCI